MDQREKTYLWKIDEMVLEALKGFSVVKEDGLLNPVKSLYAGPEMQENLRTIIEPPYLAVYGHKFSPFRPKVTPLPTKTVLDILYDVNVRTVYQEDMNQIVVQMMEKFAWNKDKNKTFYRQTDSGIRATMQLGDFRRLPKVGEHNAYSFDLHVRVTFDDGCGCKGK